MLIDTRYKVLERIGAGVWSTVFKVLDIRTDKIYALKLYQNIDSKTVYESFSAEDMFIITKLDHPNLMKVYNFGNYNGHIYSLNEYYEGKNLSQLKFSVTNIADFYWIIIQICYGLNELHKRGIIHKDLKPENIMYREEHGAIQVKILDFGFTKIDLDKNQQHISGTLPYLAPEVFKGKGNSFESDFYSLGVTLYKTVTGSLPYSLEQLTDIISGSKTGIFPKFPTELNPDIPPKLEKLILKLMEKSEEERLPDCSSIIAYINRIQNKEFTFSWKYSLINSVKNSSYLIREDYTHKLLSYIPLVEKQNGKVIVLTGEEGTGKNSILTLFRYHLLSDEYYLFDFHCTSTNKHPFFALIREFISYIRNNPQISEGLKSVSNQLKNYLDDTIEKTVLEDKEKKQKSLDLDYSFAQEFLENLSENKPLVFIIRVGHHLSKETIGFINHISQIIKSNRILIVLTLDNPGILSGLVHTVHLPVNPLNEEQVKNYIKHLLNVFPTDDFYKNLTFRSNGNPKYIREIIVDLLRKKQLLKSYSKNKQDKKEQINYISYQDFNFAIDWNKYSLPKEILHNIYAKLSHLKKESYQALQYLSISYTPLNPELIQYILNTDDKSLFFLIQDSINNHILTKNGEYIFFSYPEAKERLSDEVDKLEKIKTVTKILKYFDTQQITQIPICEGLIKNAQLSLDSFRIRKYSLLLAKLHSQSGDRENSFKYVCEVIKLDFSDSVDVSQKDILKDLEFFQETAELTGKINVALKIFDSIRNIPEIFEKYYIRGVLLNATDNFRAGLKELEKSLEIVITGKQRINALLNIVWANIVLGHNKKAQKYLETLDNMKMSPELQISYIDRKAVYLFNNGRIKEAIRLMEDFLKESTSVESLSYYARKGSFYNNLAIFYSKVKIYDEAKQYFTMAKDIWEQINYLRSLGMSYNNIGDLALRQGNTTEALICFNKALAMCTPIENVKCELLTYLNFGETYIKLGKFEKAEHYLLKAEIKQKVCKDKSFNEAIIHNIAIAKNKTKSFNNYYRFISENATDIVSGNITTINPLIKTYIQFLLDVGDEEKVIQQITNNTKLDYIAIQEEEFFHQIAGLVCFTQAKYNDALYNLHTALSYAERNRSTYAQCIIYCKIAECHLATNETEKAKSSVKEAEKLIKKYNYSYWKLETQLANIRINLLNENIGLRFVLKDLHSLLAKVSQQKLYLLEIECYLYLALTYKEIKLKKLARQYYDQYIKKAEDIVRGLPKELKKRFIDRKTNLITLAFDNAIKDSSGVKQFIPVIAPRSLQNFAPYQEQLYELLKLKDTERVKFFVSKIIKSIFTPEFFSLIITEDQPHKPEIFINYNFNVEKLTNKDFESYFQESIRSNEVITTTINNCNVLFIPLRFKNIVVGGLIIGDAGELYYTKKEIDFAKELSLHLTSLLIRIKDITVVEKNITLMKKLINANNEIFSMKDVEKIEMEMVSFCVDFTECSRAFLIKKDSFGNFVYQFAMDSYKNIIEEYSHISKTVLSEVYTREQPIYTLNALVDGTLKNSISVQDYKLHSIYCAPVIIEKDIHSLLYLDNLYAKEIDLQINIDLMEIFLTQTSTALKNAMQYAALMKKNRELHSLDTAKTEFMAIISHELNTPMMSLQNYVSQLRINYFETQEERDKLFNTIEISLSRIMDKVNDIVSFTKYSLLANIQKDKVDIKSLLEIIIKEAEIVSKERHMIFKLEVRENLPPIEANWESLYLMIYQVVLNAIRFTKDFGTIKIGVRKSSFQDEEIEGKESMVIYIQDNGIGIPTKDMDKIFKPFKELNALYSHQSGTVEFRSSGLGIGLSTAKIIAELHSGKITVKSKEGEGTSVFIVLPVTLTTQT